MANLHVTLLDKVGVHLDKFADGDGHVDELFEPVGTSNSIARARLATIRCMSTVALRQEAKSMLDGMSADDLRLVREFLAFVKSRDTNAATRELLAIPGFEKSFVRGVKDIKSRRVKGWRLVRDDV